MPRTEQFYINGEWIQPISQDVTSIINPALAAPCGSVSLGSRADVDVAVAAAKRAFVEWGKTSVQERLALLKRIVAIYERRQDEIARAMTTEMGAPISFSRTAQSGAGFGHLQGFVDAMGHFDWEKPMFPGDETNRLIHEPMGVAALITPWNWPMNQITLKVGAALAAGCTMVLKPSELAPLSAALFAEVMDEAETPPGVFNLINGTGPVVGEALASHPDVAIISLTGSTRAGIAVSKSGADGVKRISLELGGKGANILFADCNVTEAVTASTHNMFSNSGQSCNAPSRMIVHQSIYDEAVTVAAQVAQATIVGDPAVEGSHIGPVISQAQYDRVQRLIAAGNAEGARLVAGGTGQPEGVRAGFFVKPTVFADVDNGMTIAREEIFGPVLSIISFTEEDEAIAIANDSDYGLAAYLWTAEPARAARVARALRSGMVHINGSDIPFGAPFGGYGHSGIGREGGVWGIEEFVELKAVSGWQPEPRTAT